MDKFTIRCIEMAEILRCVLDSCNPLIVVPLSFSNHLSSRLNTAQWWEHCYQECGKIIQLTK